MYPQIQTITGDTHLPHHVDVAVIGGGIIGVCTAYFLAARGISVAVLEKGRLAAEQSSRNWGWCRTLGRDLAEIPLAMASLKIWDDWQTTLGEDTGFQRSGILYVCENARQQAEQAQWLRAAGAHGVVARELDPARLRQALPQAGRHDWLGALHAPADGRAEPHMATAVIARAAQRLGARVHERCAVRGLLREAGRVSGVVTEHGELRCASVVLAGGAWSSLFCRNLGIRLPQLKVIASVLRTAPMPGGPELAVGAHDFAFRKRRDGGYTIAQRSANIAPITPDSFRYLTDFLPALGRQYRELRVRLGRQFIDEWRLPTRWSPDRPSPFEALRVLDPQPDLAILAEARRALCRHFPFFEGLQVSQAWAGAMDATPDALPVIGPVAELPGLFLSTGYSGHGFGIAPGAGALMADLLSGQVPAVDPRPFRFERFQIARL
ncbi:NAD(P)/FAD-dependent oxidoreductase [Pseudomonas sp.]|uniref:NAD(P)/FAD-dependent oxidoreductase n=1 Tax=Pseudomonas sp. TaxID=306 RepID=UPI003D1172F5